MDKCFLRASHLISLSVGESSDKLNKVAWAKLSFLRELVGSVFDPPPNVFELTCPQNIEARGDSC